jgi:hypothetical protein
MYRVEKRATPTATILSEGGLGSYFADGGGANRRLGAVTIAIYTNTSFAITTTNCTLTTSAQAYDWSGTIGFDCEL